MHVLYLVPKPHHRTTRDAFTLGANAKHVRHLRIPEHSVNDLTDCFVVETTETAGWRFTLSNQKEQADIFLPHNLHLGPSKLTLAFAKDQERPTEMPNLFLIDKTESAHAVTKLKDDFTCELFRGDRQVELRNESRLVRRLKRLIIGDYDFKVYHPAQAEHAAGLHAEHLRTIAHTMPSNINDETWACVQTLGEGGFGSVDLVRGLNTGKLRARKTMKIRYGQDNCLKSFDVEAILAQNMSHDNIVSYFGAKKVHEQNGNIVCTLFMKPYLGSLEDLIRSGERHFHIIEPVAKHLSSALAYLHKHQVMHRDIKPDNVLIDLPEITEAHFRNKEQSLIQLRDRPWKFLLTDFGLSKEYLTSRDHTHCGTPGYMAPELKDGRYDYSADIYSLGVIFAQLLTKGSKFYDWSQLRHGSIDPSADPRWFYRQLKEAMIKAPVSSNYWNVTSHMLQEEAHLRPTASQLLEIIPNGMQGLTRVDIFKNQFLGNEIGRRGLQTRMTPQAERSPFANRLGRLQPAGRQFVWDRPHERPANRLFGGNAQDLRRAAAPRGYAVHDFGAQPPRHRPRGPVQPAGVQRIRPAAAVAAGGNHAAAGSARRNVRASRTAATALARNIVAAAPEEHALAATPQRGVVQKAALAPIMVLEFVGHNLLALVRACKRIIDEEDAEPWKVPSVRVPGGITYSTRG